MSSTTDTAGRDLVIVTGTSGGLGRAIAARAIADGFDVVGIARRDVTPTDIGVEAGYHHIAFNLSDLDELGALVNDIVDRFGKPYALSPTLRSAPTGSCRRCTTPRSNRSCGSTSPPPSR